MEKLFNKRKQGAQYEFQARLFLQRQGLKFIAANQTFRCGELDLVMSHGNTIVFVEVRQRSNNHFGSAVESVSGSKQQRWIRAAEAWLNQRQQSLENCDCRFDLITFDQDPQSAIEPEWFQHFIEFNNY
ncbi:YraN family protein [Testudinibacter sp. P27/CKL/0425]